MAVTIFQWFEDSDYKASNHPGSGIGTAFQLTRGQALRRDPGDPA